MFSIEREKLTSEERLNAVLSGDTPDRIPFFPFVFEFATQLAGYKAEEYLSDPEKSFNAQVLCMEVLGHEMPPIYSYANFGGWEFGGKIRWNNGPLIEEYPVSSPEDVDKLKVPAVETSGFIPLKIRFLRMAAEKKFSLFIKLGSPFSVAGNVINVSRMLEWIIDRPELVHQVLRKVTDFFVDIGYYFCKQFGSDRIVGFSAAATETLISPNHFNEFALPYLIELHEKVLDIGVPRFLTHLCGNHNPHLDYWRKVPIGRGGILSFGPEVALEKAIRKFGDSCVIAGNVDPKIILGGSPEEVYENTKNAILVGKKAPKGFILMSGCVVPPTTPFVNMYYMRKAVNDHGFYQ